MIGKWRFCWVKLWQLDGAEALRSGEPGMLALLPLLRGADLASIEEACHGIETVAPQVQQPDLLACSRSSVTLSKSCLG